MNLSIKLTLENEKVFFGPGTYTLLRFVKEAGSLLTASQMMGLSYSKARKMIKNYKVQHFLHLLILEYKVLQLLLQLYN